MRPEFVEGEDIGRIFNRDGVVIIEDLTPVPPFNVPNGREVVIGGLGSMTLRKVSACAMLRFLARRIGRSLKQGGVRTRSLQQDI